MNSSDKLKDGNQFAAHLQVYLHSFTIHLLYVKTEGLHCFVHKRLRCRYDTTAMIAVKITLAVSVIAAITERKKG